MFKPDTIADAAKLPRSVKQPRYSRLSASRGRRRGCPGHLRIAEVLDRSGAREVDVRVFSAQDYDAAGAADGHFAAVSLWSFAAR